MSPTAFAAITAAVAVAAITPGPAVTAIVARAVTDGWRPAMAINAGVVTGDLLFIALAMAGLSAAARNYGSLFDVLRVAGAIYLAWQGVVLWRARPSGGIEGAASRVTRFWPNYSAGLLLMFGHVQAMLFYAALLPGLADFPTLDWRDGLLLAAMLVVVIGGINTGYALLAARARRFFADERAQRALHRTAGTLMFAAAAVVATRV
ncbi:MAG: LysE family translocator [Lysobacterales bacterium]|nr:MAG: LysE family translocator [Xanthomonadales bacterium]